jgi:hypothetical protein
VTSLLLMGLTRLRASLAERGVEPAGVNL